MSCLDTQEASRRVAAKWKSFSRFLVEWKGGEGQRLLHAHKWLLCRIIAPHSASLGGRPLRFFFNLSNRHDCVNSAINTSNLSAVKIMTISTFSLGTAWKRTCCPTEPSVACTSPTLVKGTPVITRAPFPNLRGPPWSFTYSTVSSHLRWNWFQINFFHVHKLMNS